MLFRNGHMKFVNWVQTLGRTHGKHGKIGFLWCLKIEKDFTHPQRGPPLHKSKTWWGLRSFLKLEMSCKPWPPPLLPFTKTSRGHTVGGSMDGFTVGNSITEIKVRSQHWLEKFRGRLAAGHLSFVDFSSGTKIGVNRR